MIDDYLNASLYCSSSCFCWVWKVPYQIIPVYGAKFTRCCGKINKCTLIALGIGSLNSHTY